jgi:ribonuclease P protein component
MDERSSSVAVQRDATASLPEGRGFVSLRPGSRFAEVHRTGRRVRRGGITVIAAEGVNDLPEVGFVVGRKVGNAVVRNRVKRRLREAARKVPLRGRTAYVVVAAPAVGDVGFGDIVEWLGSAVAADGPQEAKERS